MSKKAQSSLDSTTSRSKKKPKTKEIGLETREVRKFHTHCPTCERPLDVLEEDVKNAKLYLESLGHTVTLLGEGLYAIDHGYATATYRIAPTLVSTARRLAEENMGLTLEKAVQKFLSQPKTKRIAGELLLKKPRKPRSDKGKKRGRRKK